MKFLVTGGSGFLGINLIRFLLKRNHEIVSLDLIDFDYNDVKDQITIIKGDIRNRETVKSSMQNIDVVVHTAAALPLYTPEEIHTTDVIGTRLLLEEAAQRNINRFIHISSTAVYGIPDHHPIFENDKIVGVGHYGEAKVQAEKECLNYREKGFCIPILRPKSFVGPERLGVFALLYDWAKDGKNFPMLGKGNNKYQLLDVEDLCEAIYQCATLDKNIVNDTFNIGAEKYSTMREDYQSVLNKAGFGKKIVSIPEKPAIAALRLLEFFKLSPLYKWVYETAAKDSFVSIDKAKKLLNFKPKYSNEDALLRNYEWYLENLESFSNQKGVSHRVPWSQGILKFFKIFF